MYTEEQLATLVADIAQALDVPPTEVLERLNEALHTEVKPLQVTGP